LRKLLITTKMMQDKVKFGNEFPEFEVQFANPQQYFNERECLALVGDFDAWICGDDVITRSVIKKAQPRLKILVKWGAGLDSIDLEAAAELSLTTKNTPGVLSNGVAEYALGMTIGLLRKIVFVDREVRSGSWPKLMGQDISGSTVGILGYGSIGKQIAQKFELLGANVLHHDPKSANSKPISVLLKTSDVVIVSTSLTESSRGMISREEFALMKNTAVLVNVSRGEVVNEDHLVEALAAGNLAGAALDVFTKEPLVDPKRFDPEKTILGSHNANNSFQSVGKAHVAAITLIKGHLASWG